MSGTEPKTQAQIDVILERNLQIVKDSLLQKREDDLQYGELSDAAICYAISKSCSTAPEIIASLWPFEFSLLKPEGRRSDLVRAAALIIAEIERLDRKVIL